jgi:hypothetical protein
MKTMREGPFERIRFSIKGPDGVYHGEVTGNELRDNAKYNVSLATGESFEVEALSNDEGKYHWIASKKKTAEHLVPVVGGIIERYFRRKGKNVE